MKSSHNSRRIFIKSAVGTGLMVAGTGMLASGSLFRMSGSAAKYDAKGLPTVLLGSTGVRIPRMAIGLGSRFCNIKSTDEALQLLTYALDNGLYYWDTAGSYENKELGIISEVRLGEVVKTRRNEIFLSTKVTSRNPDEAMKQIELSLKRLNTDHLDILKIHSVTTVADVDKLSEKGNLIDLLQKLKEQKICRFIGFTGHTEAEALRLMTERGQFDTMLFAMNHYNMATNPQKRTELVIPAAKAKGMGVMLMKVVRPRETVKDIKTNDLIRFGLSLKGPDGIILGMDSLEVVKSNLEILRSFKPLDDTRMQELAQQLTPFYRHENLPWMQEGYSDGEWA
jgi:aryl-alcohol dehydrogenase-like predicted oxidoreductase